MKCNLCPHNCDIDRLSAQGFCAAPDNIQINTAILHFGEEPVLSGHSGSGTIFFSHCNMRCVYCQNYQISAYGAGEQITDERLIEIAFDLQSRGAMNINLVSPTPYAHRLIPILQRLKKEGLHIPIVWNSNAYEKVDTFRQLDGLVDIYLPDFRYWDDEVAFKYSGVKNYRQNAQEAIKEMHRQTGHLIVDEDGIAIFGTLVRLLVLPADINGVKHIIHWLYETFGNEIYLSAMSQYYPAFKATQYPEINRGLYGSEYEEIVTLIETLGFENGFIQQPAMTPEWTPEFKKNHKN